MLKLKNIARNGFVAGGALALLAGCALPPSSVSKAQIANFETAVASIGCIIRNESDLQPVGLQAGLTRAQVDDIIAYEIAAENALPVQGGGMKLTTGACA